MSATLGSMSRLICVHLLRLSTVTLFVICILGSLLKVGYVVHILILIQINLIIYFIGVIIRYFLMGHILIYIVGALFIMSQNLIDFILLIFIFIINLSFLLICLFLLLNRN